MNEFHCALLPLMLLLVLLLLLLLLSFSGKTAATASNYAKKTGSRFHTHGERRKGVIFIISSLIVVTDPYIERK
jgi:hypothetical protein